MYDVFYLSYDEPYANGTWKVISENVPIARRVSGIVGIQAAHARCAKLARTSHFFVIDADNEVLDYSVFDFEIPTWDEPYVHLWYAKNPVNDLEYGWGGIKLFPKAVFGDTKPRLDMTTSFPLKVMEEVVSITHFNVSPLETWRSAFRECVKLASAPLALETERRLTTWCSVGHGPHAAWSIKGAQAGRSYGSRLWDQPDQLAVINDYHWLLEAFEAQQ